MKIDLFWHTDADDIRLGEAHVDVLPPPGTLIYYAPSQAPAPSPASWRVVVVQIIPAAPESMAVLYSGREQYGIYHVFVEPAEGPFHP